MDVTTMPSIPSLIAKLQADYPNISFQDGQLFEWSPSASTITYDPLDPLAISRLLHEVGHAELAHSSYERDIELIAHERDAWHQAKTVLAPRYGLAIDIDIVEDDMDSYRDWMHARSTCPHCEANGIQTDGQLYACVVCRNTWHVNEARQSRLYRRLASPVIK
ncbi:MAG: hypothetical protein ACSLEY_01770 [Candidatus Saccharimonadales bacterium]